ncbi:hypothetical protein IH980_03275 [Patescibacteria group bacterium]|nr:hypothetical protein [Patescibacteria group bacterium]
MSVFVVIPTIRDLAFLKSWKGEFRDCQIVIIEDREKKEIACPSVPAKAIHHFSWEDIHKDFGIDEWIFSRKNAGIRSYGFWKAYRMGADVVITLDDDCYPTGSSFVQTHLENLSVKAPRDWYPTYPDPKFMFTRGFPYKARDQTPVMISHGLWSGVVDLDAKTLVNFPKLNQNPYPPIRQFVPNGLYFPMSSMNLAFKREATPLMYFPLMGVGSDGTGWGYDRFDDIWAGLFAKKIVDHLGWSIVSGSPFVHHKGASDRFQNIQKEKDGLVVNEWLWRRVDSMELTRRTAARCYLELAEKIRFPKQRYFRKLREAMLIWAKLFLH